MLSLATVSASYGSFQALFGVSLEVSRGEAVGVIGPNGAGKTTLMRVISGILPMRQGEMTLEGHSIGGMPAHRVVEQGIAHVPENRRLFPRLSVEENLRVGAFIPSARARFSERLDWVFDLFPRLKDRRNQLAGTMSGGEQQMLAIGRALMAEPRLLLVDELSLGLMPKMVDLCFESLAHLRRSGLTVVLVEQNTLRAIEIADTICVLSSGSVVFSGPAAAAKADGSLFESFLGGAN